MGSVKTEFSPDYFRSIFGDAPSEWATFIEVNLRSFNQGLERLRLAANHQDMAAVSEIRHSMGPSMQQWGAITLEAQMMALTANNLAVHWPTIESELQDLINALEALE